MRPRPSAATRTPRAANRHYQSRPAATTATARLSTPLPAPRGADGRSPSPSHFSRRPCAAKRHDQRIPSALSSHRHHNGLAGHAAPAATSAATKTRRSSPCPIVAGRGAAPRSPYSYAWRAAPARSFSASVRPAVDGPTEPRRGGGARPGAGRGAPAPPQVARRGAGRGASAPPQEPPWRGRPDGHRRLLGPQAH